MSKPKLIEDLGIFAKNNTKPTRWGLYECPLCSATWVARTYDVNSGTTSNCVPCGNNLTALAKVKHSGCATKLYSLWSSIRDRCTNKNDKRYKNYGGRGITRCPEWNDFAAFRDWALATGYTEGLSIERMNNDGSYEPNNCTWVPLSDQAANRNINTKNTTGYIGVSLDRGRPRAVVTYKGVKYLIGYFNTAEEAAHARDKYITKHNLPHKLNFEEMEM